MSYNRGMQDGVAKKGNGFNPSTGAGPWLPNAPKRPKEEIAAFKTRMRAWANSVKGGFSLAMARAAAGPGWEAQGYEWVKKSCTSIGGGLWTPV